MAEATLTQKKSGPSFPQEELDNRRRQFARKLFLEQLDIKCKNVRADLLKIWKKLEPQIRAAVSMLQDQLDDEFDAIREEVLAGYSSSEEGTISVSGPTANVWSWYRTAPQGPDTLRSELEINIHSWAREHRIKADWVINTAIENIANWYESSAKEERQSWFPPSIGMLGILTKEELELQFSHQFLSGPSGRTREDMRHEAWRQFDKVFAAWFRNLDKSLKSRGYEKNLRWDHPERDVRWFVQFQCKREEYADIAEGQEEVTASAVSKAVKKAAEYLDIKPRKARCGRRSKKKLT
jgi:hypothetical protein